jgi:hypothetical protein
VNSAKSLPRSGHLAYMLRLVHPLRSYPSSRAPSESPPSQERGPAFLLPLFTLVRASAVLRTSEVRSSEKLARRTFSEVLEEGYRVGASPHKISRPEWGLALMTLGGLLH